MCGIKLPLVTGQLAYPRLGRALATSQDDARRGQGTQTEVVTEQQPERKPTVLTR